MLETRCIKFIWNVLNSAHELHKAVAIICIYKLGSTLAEHIRYFMYKYNILIDDWHNISYLARKVYKYDDHFVNIDNKCIANSIIDLCRQHDNSCHCAKFCFLF